jgi:hypothetical protein
MADITAVAAQAAHDAAASPPAIQNRMYAV